MSIFDSEVNINKVPSIANYGEMMCYHRTNKHETSSSSCGGVFGNTKLLLIFLLMTSLVIAYLIKSFVIAHLITLFVIAYLITSFEIAYLITLFVIAFAIQI